MLKKIMSIAVLCAVLLSGCSSDPKVTRVSTDTQTDLSGYWNDSDVRQVCETLSKDFLDEISHVPGWGGDKKPVILVSEFRNETSEHIDASIISRRMERAIRQSGRADFVAGNDIKNELRQERQEQQAWASEETAKALANETGADFMLAGTVKSMEDRNFTGTTARNYMVFAELYDIETRRKIWDGEGEIKKVIQTPRSRL